MEPRDLRYWADAADGQLLGGQPDSQVRNICTDSREAGPGDLFVALEGTRVDGHVYLNQAIARGAVAAVVKRGRNRFAAADHGLILVPDTRRALGLMGARYRSEFKLPVIAVAGSNGKTSTKDFLRAVLGGETRALASPASFNNEIGVPLTLLRLEFRHRAAVVEVGTNHPGELAPLLAAIRPRYGVLTSIGREHLEYFGDLEGVIREEGTLAECLPAGGILFMNGDSPGREEIRSRCRARIVTVGLGEGNDLRVRPTEMNLEGGVFHLEGDSGVIAGEYRIPVPGRHQMVNAALAIAVALELDVEMESVRKALAEARISPLRLERFEWHGAIFLNDAYNANADSTAAALEILGTSPVDGRRVAVLGDMAELGEHAAAAHREMGGLAVKQGVDWLLALGAHAQQICEGAAAAGLRAEPVPSVVEVLQRLRTEVKAGDVVLVKGSRSARLERIVEGLRSGGEGRS